MLRVRAAAVWDQLPYFLPDHAEMTGAPDLATPLLAALATLATFLLFDGLVALLDERSHDIRR